MSTLKISQLTDLAAAPASDDKLVIVDQSAGETKRVNVSDLFSSLTFSGTTTIPTLVVTSFTLDGTAITATGAELNLLDGVTATTAELNYIDGVTSNIQTQIDGKVSAASPTFTGTATIPTAAITTLNLGGVAVTATAAEINTLDGITATVTELNYVDGVTSSIQTQLDSKIGSNNTTLTGTTTIASLTLGATAITATGAEINYVDGVTSNIQTQLDSKAPLASPTFTGTATIPTASVTSLSLGGTAITSTAAELNILDGVTATAAELNILDGVTATATELNYVDGVTSNVQTQLDAKVAKSAAVFDGSIEEQQYSLTGTVIDPANGTIQYKTLSANTTFTESLTDGEYVILMINDGTGYTITWPTITWVGGSAPTLETTGYNVINIWQVNGTVYGVFVGAA